MPLKEEFITYNPQEEGAQYTMRDHMGKNQGWLEGQKKKKKKKSGNHEQKVFITLVVESF